MRLLVQRSDVGEFRKRYRWMVLAVLVSFLGLTVRIAQLQIVERDIHKAQARRNIIGTVTLATTRGVIRDRTGKVLAANRPSYDVYVVPEKLDLEETWPKVVQLMGLSAGEEAQLKEKILGQTGRLAQQQMLLEVDVQREVFAALMTHRSDLPGVIATPSPVRYYPFGEIGAHLIGYMRETSQDDLGRLGERDYRAGDRLGAIGVEKRWESYLRGQRGWQKRVMGRRARKNIEQFEEKYLEEPRRLEPIPGRDLSLTVDVDLLKSIESAMRGQLAGAVVVVDVRTGRLLAALSKPGFNSNVVSGSLGKKAIGESFRRMYKDPLKPLLDKTISAAYPPGSTYKPFSALAGLNEQLVTPHTEVDCKGGFEFGRRYFRCTGVHRRVDLYDAIVQSCNTYFYNLGELIHIDRLSGIGMDFGFGVKTGIGINPESRGRMPTRAWYARRYKGEGFRGGFTLLSSIGQGATTVTVMQLALAYAALANGGTVYQPQVVRSIETSDGTVAQDFPPRVRRIIDIPPDRLQLIRNALKGVVFDRQGTAHKEALDGVDMAGKTGTAQVSHVTPRGVDPDKVWYFNRDHAWFSGYAPADSPEIAIVVLIEHGGGGGKNAVPVAMRVVRDWQQLREERKTVERTTEERAKEQQL
jgi:penicillin-binding protein 2